MPASADCLSTVQIVPSGLFLALDSTSGIPVGVRQAERIPGIVQVHFGNGALGALNVTAALREQPGVATAHMVEILSDTQAASITWDALAERSAVHGIYIDVPNRPELLSLYPDRVLPIDANHRFTTAENARGVRVLPVKHLLPLPSGAVAPAAYAMMPGQIRHAGTSTHVGLPAEVVNSRHPSRTEIPTLVELPELAEPRPAIDSHAKLIRELEELNVGEQRVLEVKGSETVRTSRYLVIREADGLSVLGERNGRIVAEPLPREFTSLRIGTPKIAESRPTPVRKATLADQRAAADQFHATAQRQIEQGDALIAALSDLTNHSFIKKNSFGDAFRVWLESNDVLDAVLQVRQADTALKDLSLWTAEPGAAENRARAVDKIAASIVHFAQVSEDVAHSMQAVVDEQVVAAVVEAEGGEASETIASILKYSTAALNTVAAATLPTGMTFAPALVQAGNVAASQLALKAFKLWREHDYQQAHSVGEALGSLDKDPTLMAKKVIESYKRGFELVMAFAGVGGAYFPAWPVLSAGVTAIVNGYLDDIMRRTSEIAGADHTNFGMRMAEEGYKAIKEKVESLDTWKSINDAAKGEPNWFELGGIGTEILTRTLMPLITRILPPRAEELVTGDDLRKLITRLVGEQTGRVASQPTLDPTDFTRIPDGVPRHDRHGRPVELYAPLPSTATNARVAVRIQGTLVWGELNVATAVFTPTRLDPSAVVPQHDWLPRVVNAAGYKIGDRQVKGTWHRPRFDGFRVDNNTVRTEPGLDDPKARANPENPNTAETVHAGGFDAYLFISEDGVWEWAHTMSPTSGMDSDEYNLSKTFDKNPEWIKPFRWDPPGVLAVDFAKGQHTLAATNDLPGHNPWALRQFAADIARRALLLSAVRGTTTGLLKINIEGSGHHHTLSFLDSEETPRQRATAVHDELRRLVTQELNRRLTPDRAMPDVGDMFASRTTRDTEAASRAPRHVRLGDAEAQERQTLVWVDEVGTPLKPGSMAFVQDTPRSTWLENIVQDDHFRHPQAENLIILSATKSTEVPKLPDGLLDAAKARPNLTVVVLPDENVRTPETHRRRLALLLEQFSMDGRTVVTIAPRDLVTQMRSTVGLYGGGLIRLAKPKSGGGLNVRNEYEATSSTDDVQPRQARLESDRLKVTAELLDMSWQLSKPTEAVKQVDPVFGSWLFDPSVRSQVQKMVANLASIDTPSNRERLDQTILRQTENSSIAVAREVLKFGPKADVVVQVVEAPEKRPATVLSAFANKVASAADLVGLSKAATLGDTAKAQYSAGRFTESVLSKLESIITDKGFTDAAQFITDHKDSLDGAQRTSWAKAITDLNDTFGDKYRKQLEELQTTVLDCFK
jgi:hypothetical protein